MLLFVIDGHPIYRRGLVASLAAVRSVEQVVDVASVDEADTHPALPAAGVVLIDSGVYGWHDLVRRLHDSPSRVLVCSAGAHEDTMLAAVAAGAVGYLRKDTLTPDSLVAAVDAAATGSGVIERDLLSSLMREVSRVSNQVLEPRGLSLARLTARERQVLRLVAQGMPTREVARELSYSERTIKTIMHDVVTKLDARSRSQAVAQAVRDGLI